jgi:hypothetical protein
MLYQPVLGPDQQERCSKPKILGKHDASKFGRLAGGVSPKRLVGQRIELACLHISLEPVVPGLSIERCIPSAERRKFNRGKTLNLLFDRFNLAHTSPY